ncbi:MAG: MATE family efflux transporter [Lachnospiraceae bacterium]|nr:MATE family efflux transporter [Lachnospiraceae bacterium]
MDLTQGPLAGKLLIFTLPVMLAGILQLLFNAADIIVVGRLAGSNSLAAVGSNGALINLIVNLLVGLSVGSGVAAAYFYGAGEKEQVKETIHTSVAISLLGGVVTGIIGVILSPILLRLMGTPESILGLSQLYLRIYFLGMPAMSAYNFGSAILRSLGDTKHPLLYLIIAGIVNIILNVILVAVFHLDVAGVAIATVISQTISAVLLFRCLMRLEPEMCLEWRKVRISKQKLIRILRVGLPAGLQSTVFSFSNVLIQSSINGFGELAVAGNSAAGNIEGFIYIAMNSFYQAAQTFTSQNVGARRFERINKVFLYCFLMVTATGLVLGQAAYRMGNQLLGIYLPGNIAAIEYGMIRLSIIASMYCLCGIMEVISGEIRGMGESVLPMIVSLVGSCVLRVIWICTVFAAHHTLTVLYLSYPVSWIVTEFAHLMTYFYVKRRLIRSVL